MSKIPARQCIVSKQSYFRQFYPHLYKAIHLRNFFSSTNILALGFYLSERKKKVFWKISFILLPFKIKQTKPDSEGVQSICCSCCPCLVKDSTIPLELLLQTIYLTACGFWFWGFFWLYFFNQECCATRNF